MFITRLIDQGFPPASAFDVDRDIPDLGGKVVIVTGGNTGIGKETVKALLKKNAKVYLAARSKARAEGAISELKTETGKEAIFLELDLADLGKVSRAAEEFQRKEKELHILFNSAGVMIPPIDQLTADGYDLQFGTNVLGPAHFTLSLLPILLSTAKSSPPGTVRVVNTSSFVVYRQVASVRFDTLRDGPERKELGTKKLYDQSKYGVLAFSNELARRYGSKGIHSNAVNPGNLRTDLQRHIPAAARVIVNLILHPAPLGALTQLYVGTSPETADANGRWFIPWARWAEHSKETKDEEVEGKLWAWIQEQRKGC